MKIAIIGGGQLGAMLADAAVGIGVTPVVIDPVPVCSASFSHLVLNYSYEQVEEITNACKDCDAVTYEFENIPLALISSLDTEYSLYPPVVALEVTKHRGKEKDFAQKLGIPVAGFEICKGVEALRNSLEKRNSPAIVKRCSEGYDGKGQWRYSVGEDVLTLLSDELPFANTYDYIVEDVVSFDYEVSCIGVRSTQSEKVFYDLCENKHVSGTLVRTVVPSTKVSNTLTEKVRGYTDALLEGLEYVGTLAVEYFVVGEEVYFNEYAPRVHNSGHWSIEGAVTSQFENHIRACLGMPLGDSSSKGHSVMFNLLGIEADKDVLAGIPAAKLHWYNKEIKPKRKVGHITVATKSDEELQCHIDTIQSWLPY